ncbi:MAG: indole-3-glycerol phosphate synthase TrpC [Actinomycetota bacterium]|nr:indole-3-glycerol phosphate synthase TrpC [Actinomycetota bacterium]
MATYLDRILTAHREAAASDHRPVETLIDEVRLCPPCRGFSEVLAASSPGEPAVIAEVKRRSPSKGELCGDLDPAAVAGEYALGGATCLSVLTDRAFFGGSPDDLTAVRAAVGLPVIRKDFTVSARDVCDARLMGADAVLLIAAALDDAELADFHDLAAEIGLDALVEVHDESELERALTVGATLVGVNQRDLTTFEVDTARAVRMAPAIPDNVVRVAESGIGGPEDARALVQAGYHALLVGESLVTSGDRAAAVRSLRQCTQVG